jgi:hypothetical protein
MLRELITCPISPKEGRGQMLALNKAFIEWVKGAEMNSCLCYAPGPGIPAG